MKTSLIEFTRYLIENLVSKPEEVKIKNEEKEGVVHLLVDVAEEDRGRLIGKEGRIITSLRHLINIKAQKEGQRFYLTLDF